MFGRKKDTDDHVSGPGRSPKLREERRLRRALRFHQLLVLVLIGGYVLYTAAVAFQPTIPVIVNKHDQIQGEYRDSLWRSQDDYRAAAKVFVTNRFSANSARIVEQLAIAHAMMSPALRQEDLRYFKEVNYVKRLELAETESRFVELEARFSEPPQGRHARVEVEGTLKVWPQGGREDNESAKRYPVHVVLDMRPERRVQYDTGPKGETTTVENSYGIEITDYADFSEI